MSTGSVPIRKRLPSMAAAIALAALGLSCYSGPPSSVGEAAVSAAQALAATASAKTPQFPPYRTPTPEPPPGDNATLDLLLRALYEGVSHTAATEPDWERLEPLFVPGARLMPPRHPGDSNRGSLSFDEFRQAARQGIATRREQGQPTGFFEQEIGRETVVYGGFAAVLSAYEARFARSDPKPFLRGVNSIQAVRSGDRWAILAIVWDTEGPDNPIPERLLRAPSETSRP